MRKETFGRDLSLLVAFVFLLTSIGPFAFAAGVDSGRTIEFTPNLPTFTTADSAATVRTPKKISMVAPILPNTPDKREIWVEIATGSSLKTVQKFYLTDKAAKPNPAVTGTALKLDKLPGKTTQAAFAYIGIVDGATLQQDEFVTITAVDMSNQTVVGSFGFTVKKYTGGGTGGGGSGGGKPSQKPADKKPTPAKPDTGTSGQSSRFNDVKTTDWFYADVEYVVKNGLFAGVSTSTFAPRTPMTRGMIVTVLGRLDGVSTSAYTSGSFSDVAAGQYYTAYVEWAKARGIVNGVGGNRFAPDAEVSRQDFAVILLRYAEFSKKTLPNTRQPVLFTDESEIAGYAKNAVRTLYAGAIVNGVGKNAFSPTKSATRAEVAAMLHRFVEATKK
ncbi:MAG: S-layer homology domain-containing protein [Clostridiales Family XIII bacterium]|jgi:hypothetical protein|nr:S-layer homology domain-containing protein [Clostridiales Family XIII bacterium]